MALRCAFASTEMISLKEEMSNTLHILQSDCRTHTNTETTTTKITITRRNFQLVSYSVMNLIIVGSLQKKIQKKMIEIIFLGCSYNFPFSVYILLRSILKTGSVYRDTEVLVMLFLRDDFTLSSKFESFHSTNSIDVPYPLSDTAKWKRLN